MTRDQSRLIACWTACKDIPTVQLQPSSVKALVEALDRIATWGDTKASMHLEETGSYSWFDEPGSVQMARAALAPFKGESK